MSRGGEAAAQKERREEGRTRRRRRRRKAAAAAENEEKENKSADRHGWRKRTRASMRAVGDAIDDAGDGGRGWKGTPKRREIRRNQGFIFFRNLGR
ncbi:hypothetical protein BHE74_00038045 [Ensete ventricosum]|nr:hypothetical protein BHE74_00038045 [Ensete ventricosum]